ncbi:M23 family metallopeptidase [Sphaerisporangium sp. TRM90804]|nr:M23 family metallopeptidase [Sphaerisporangium sp. TRM90804]
MRSGRLAAIAVTALVTAACGTPGGVAGISTLPPPPPSGSTTPTAASATDGTATGDDASAGATATTTPAAAGTPEAPTASPTATDRDDLDAASLEPEASPKPVAVTPPPGDDPVRMPPPKVSRYSYLFPVRGCRVDYARTAGSPPKTTIWAGRGCAFVAPVDGRVHEVNALNRWRPSTDRGADREGRFVSIIGADGVRYLGGHLEAVSAGIRPGVPVRAGQVLGTVGNSGDARDGAPNLHFAVSWPTDSRYWWVRRGMVDPWSYLDAWMSGNRTLSPGDQVAAVRAQVGSTPPCRVLCASKPVKQRPKPRSSPTGDPSPVVTRGAGTAS